MILTSSNHPGDLPYLGVPENNRYGAPLHKVGSNTQGEAENVDNTCYKIYIFQSQLYCGEVPLIPTNPGNRVNRESDDFSVNSNVYSDKKT